MGQEHQSSSMRGMFCISVDIESQDNCS